MATVKILVHRWQWQTMQNVLFMWSTVGTFYSLHPQNSRLAIHCNVRYISSLFAEILEEKPVDISLN